MLSAELAGFARSGLFSDVKVVCGAEGCESGVFWAHRFVLAGVSPFLKDVFLEQGKTRIFLRPEPD